MLAPDHLVVFDKLMPLAVGEEFLEGLRIKDRLPGASGQFHEVVQVHRDHGVVRRMVQAIGFALLSRNVVQVVELIPELFEKGVIRKQTAFPLDGAAQQIFFQPVPPFLIEDGKKDGQGAPAGRDLSMVLDDALVPQGFRCGLAGLNFNKGFPVFVEYGAFGFQGCGQETAHVLSPLTLEPAGDLA